MNTLHKTILGIALGSVLIGSSLVYSNTRTETQVKPVQKPTTVTKVITKKQPPVVPKIQPLNIPNDPIGELIKTLPPEPLSDRELEFERRTDEFEKGIK
jgi:hypothetical protein